MKKILVMAAAMLFSLQGIHAQTDVTEETDSDDIITVTDKDGKQEEIEVPEGLEDNLDSLLHLYNAQTYMMADTTCKYRDVNPVFEKEVYIDRLKRMPTIIEMPYNEVVQKFIDRYSGKLRRSVSFMLGASNFYMPIFEEALEAYNLPLELKYLPVIESALNPKAVSRVGATGLWQFMLPTGKRYGLEVNSLIDERRDPVKASYAAAHYLSDLYKIFDDWSLVIAAYNCGPTNVNKAIHRAKGNADYWNIYPYLPKETRGYVPAFIAANYIMNYYCDHNICPMVSELPVKTDTIVVSKDIHLEQISKVLNIDIEHLRNLNPQYRHDIINGLNHPMALRLPSTLIGSFIDQQDSICAYRADELFLKRATVDVNDAQPTYSRPRSSYSRHSASSRSKKSSKRGRNRKQGSKSVTIKNGDTLSEIAARNGTTVKKLRKLNGIKGNSIRAGKKIKDENVGKEGIENLDTGFRVLKLDTSNMEDVYYTPLEFTAQDLFNENVKADRTNEDLLFQVMLDLGIELSAKIETKQIAGKHIYMVDDNYLVACFDRDVNETTITEIAKQHPVYFVMRDASAANDNVIDNFEQIFKHYSPGTNCRII